MEMVSAAPQFDPTLINLGIEVRSPIKKNLFDWYNSGLISHAQVTLPNIIDLPTLEPIWQKIPIIFHSNLLNVMGTNDFTKLGLLAKKLSEVPSPYIIEHFTLLQKDNHKFGLCPTSALKDDNIHISIENINHWKQLTGKQIALENVPITESVDKYFELLIGIRAATESLIVCDIPHLLISALAAKWDENQLSNITNQLKPVQIHVSGLSQTGNLLTDNHKAFDPKLIAIGKQLFPQTKIVTIEQDGMLTDQTLQTWLLNSKTVSISADSPKNYLNELRELEAPTISDQNKHLSQEALRLFGGLETFQQNLSAPYINESNLTALILLDYVTPFVSPLAVLQKAVADGKAEKAISLASAICLRASSLASWLSVEHAKNYQISFGESECAKFSYRSNPKWPSTSDLGNCEKLRFSGKTFWLEITTPKLL